MHRLHALAQRVGGWPDLPVVAAVLLTLAALVEVNAVGLNGADSATAAALAFSGTAPHVLSGRYLAVAAVVVCSAAGTWFAFDGTLAVTVLIGQLWMVYRIAGAYSRPWLALALGPSAANAVYPFANGPAQEAVIILGLGVVAAILGDAMRQRRLAIAERDVARDETAEARRDQAVLAERSRIARELHDVVAHHVSMMVVQAETARVSTPGLTPPGARGLESIRDTGREALSELRRVLGVLRSPDLAGDRAPQPGLDQIAGLVEAAAAAGVRVRLRREGGVRPLPAGVELCAYRIVQEALTNIRRHAPGAAADVVLCFGPAELSVEVRNDGPGSSGPGSSSEMGSGFGIVGMRERAALAGGHLYAGPAPGGGFEVVADLPLTPVPASPAAVPASPAAVPANPAPVQENVAPVQENVPTIPTGGGGR